MQRQRPNENRLDVLKRADELFGVKRYFDAFAGYCQVLQQSDNSQLSLFCKARMLFCQYEVKAIRVDLLVARLTSLVSELTVEISICSHNKALFEMCCDEAKRMLANLTTPAQKKAYLCAAVAQMIQQSEFYELEMYHQIREFDKAKLTYEADYLNAWYEDLVAAGIEGSLRAYLAEIIADSYNMRIDDFPEEEREIKKLLLGMAKESYERAMFCWRDCDSDKKDKLLMVLLHIMRELYSLAVTEQNDVDRVRIFKEFGSLLMCVEGGSTAFGTRKGFEECRAWHASVSMQMTSERRASLDRLLMPPPPSRSHLYRGVAASPAFFIASENPIEVLVNVVEILSETPTIKL